MNAVSNKADSLIGRRIVQHQGFTLIELAIVLTIAGLLFGSSLSSYSRWRAQQKYQEVEALLQRLHNSVIGYAMSYGKLPCPASLDSLDSTAGEDEFGNCRHYQGGFSASVYGSAESTNSNGLVLDPWNRPIRFVLSDTNAIDLGDADKDDWVHSQEIRSIGASQLEASIDICINHIEPCSANGDAHVKAVVLLYSLGADSSTRGKQLTNQDGDSLYMHAPFHLRAGAEFDDTLMWISKHELIYWLVRAAQLP